MSALRLQMLDIYKIRPFMPMLLVSEDVVDGRSRPCRTAEETYAAAKSLRDAERQGDRGRGNGDRHRWH